MSDGTINFPLRTSHPSPPTAGRVLTYTFDNGSSKQPYYMQEDGVPRTLVGATGDAGQDGNDGQDGADGATGSQGLQGIQGIQGEVGPVGPMNVEAFISETGTVTLPNSTAKQDIYTDNVTISATGNCFLDISLAIKPHSTGNDMEFDIEFNNSVLTPLYNEEHKDTNTVQSNWRHQCFDLGNISLGNYPLVLRFSKESTGGTAQLKNYTAKLVRFS